VTPIPGVRCLPLADLQRMTPRQRDEYAASLYRRGRDASGNGSPGELDRMRESAQAAAAQARSANGRLGRLGQDVNELRGQVEVRDARIAELEAELTRHRTFADPCPAPVVTADRRARQAFLLEMTA
jgi:hypothetical protein